MDAVMEFLNKALAILVDNSGLIGTVLGILFALAKAISNEKAPKLVAVVQGAFDLAAKAFEVLGKISLAASNFLAALIKSDGILGKK